MNAASEATKGYVAQLERYASDLAAGQIEQVIPGLAAGSLQDDVARYVENAVGERLRMLVDDTQLVALAFDDIESLIAEYIGQFPRPTYCWGRREASAFLEWLSARPLDLRATDFVAFQRAEFACLELCHQRLKPLRRFRAATIEPELGLARLRSDPDARLVLNPARVWTQLSGRSLGRAESEMSPVLFAPKGENICQHAFTVRERARFDSLESLATCTLSHWQRTCGLSSDEAFLLVRDWLEKEIVAVV